MLSIAGFTTVVAAIYLVIVLGIGSGPSDAADREVLGLSMLAAAVAAIGYLPARDRLVASATRFVYGAKEAPDETLRTFGSRLTRAIPMDELLLQLAESLRKTMALTSAEVYTGQGDVLERVAAVPDTGPRSVVVDGPGARCRDQGRGFRQRLGLGLAARSAGRAGRRSRSGSRRSAMPASCSG